MQSQSKLLREAMDVINAIQDTFTMVNVLSDDLDRITASLDRVKLQGELQFWLRVVVRAAVDSLDAYKYRLKLLTRTALSITGKSP